jgi:hypothetical protein
MSIKNYRFVSPGVFVHEIDNSQLPASPAGIGPVVIGRAEKGPSLRPVTVSSFEEFVNTFGTPSAGGAGDDVWRQGSDKSATTYGMYAAQAYLRNSSPLTYIRLLGAQHDNAGATAAGGAAGWSMSDAYGLIVFQSGTTAELTGALAAVFYVDSTATIALSGTLVSASATGITITSTEVTGVGVVVQERSGVDYQFIMDINGDKTTFNFNENDSKYIRKVFNTNPQLTNSGITAAASRQPYFLGETFDRHLKANITTTGDTMAALVKLYDADNSVSGSQFLTQVQSAETPQVISCDLGSGVQNLFKFVALNQPGDWTNRNIKISIQDIKRSSTDETDYGSFSVVVRHLSDSDNVVKVIEQFNNCDLNPDSPNYIARRIGDKYLDWTESERRYTESGNWPNVSRYVRVEMNSDVDAGLTNPALLPFGWLGMVKYQDDSLATSATSGSWITGSTPNLPAAVTVSNAGASLFVFSGSAGAVVDVLYPAPEFRVSASDGYLSNPTDAYFGFQTSKTAGSTVFDRSNIDLLRPRGGIVASMFASPANSEKSMTFSLDDISGSGVWIESSFANSTSLTAVSGAVSGVLDSGYDRFTIPLYGGFDGVDVLEMDAFCNTEIGTSDTSNYEFNSLRRAIDAVADPEVVEMNIATVPGLTNEGLTTHLVRTCEERADALAIIDLPNAFQPREESTAIARLNNASTISTLVNGLRSRGLNSSYGCAFYPWVRARDAINGSFVWLPPSIPALGTFSSSQRKTQVWFAPAGFNRGGLTEGSAGIPVVDVAHHLRRQDRDDLYAANINRLQSSPLRGIVIFGQKTLQVTPSALDRINVRRLMIFVKKRISQIASRLLFDPNAQLTWKRFLSEVNPFLADVKTNFGLSDYKVILDGTTTTADLIDRNILYAKIFLKPTRAIEFIAIDFNITRTGASFSD